MSHKPTIDDDVKRLIQSSLYFYRSNLSEIVRIFWLPFLVLAIFKGLSFPSLKAGEITVNAPVLVFQLALTCLVNIVVILFIFAKTQDKSVNIRILYQTAFRFWPSVFIIYMVIGTLFAVGFWLLIVPGIWILTRLILSDIIYVIEKPGIVPALKQSMTQTNENFWLIFLSVLAVSFVVVLARLAVFTLGIQLSLLTAEDVTGTNIPFTIITDILTSFAFLMVHIMLFRVYILSNEKREDA